MATSEVRNNASIVESGTSGIWKYRKWSDGTAECWGTSATISPNFNSNYGNGFYAPAQTNQNYPTGLFVDVPRIIVVPISGDGVYIGVSAITKDGFAYYPYCNASGNHYVRWDCHAIGRWK